MMPRMRGKSLVVSCRLQRGLLLVNLLGASLALPTGAVAESAASESTDAIEVRGDVTTPGTLNLRELQAMPTVQADWTVHGKTRHIVGVPLAKALEKFGVGPGAMSKEMAPKDKRAGYKKVVVASAADGFQAVLSLAEISEGMGKTQALLVFQIDGQPLRAEEKPLRLAVLSDGEPSRSLYQLRRIDVVDLRKVIPPMQAGKK